MPVIGADIAFLRRGEFRVALLEVAGASAAPPDRMEPDSDLFTLGNKHLCYRVTNLAATLRHLRERGADVASELIICGTPIAFIRDNAGNAIQLVERPACNGGHGADARWHA